MARFDKYDPVSGGFRGKLKAALTISTAADKEKLWYVSVEAGTGLLVVGTAVAATAVRGVINVRESKAAGDIVDVMTAGEIANFNFLNDGVTATVLGTPYYADNTAGGGGLTATATTNKQVGVLVADSVAGRNRLIVRCTQ
jgi:hypothetical protein